VVEGSATLGASGCRVMVPVADADAHHARAVAAGTRVMGEPTTYPFGERQYSQSKSCGS
jgi:predicted enzyme related to lactoylglutathione lyase